MIGLNTTLTYPLVIVIAMILAGASFLGYEHILTGDFVSTIYGAILSGAIVGHFAGNTPNSGNPNG